MNDLENPLLGSTSNDAKRLELQAKFERMGAAADSSPQNTTSSSIKKGELSLDAPGLKAFTAEDVERERKLAQKEGRGNWTSAKFEGEKELEIKKKIQELKARKPLPQEEAMQLKGLYRELETIREASARKRTKAQLTSEQRMSLKDIITQVKSDRQSATKNEGDFVRERTELMNDNEKLAKDIDDLSKVVRELEGKSGKEKSDASTLLKSLKAEKREIENTLHGYKPEGDLARGEFLLKKLTEAVDLEIAASNRLIAARKKTGTASSEELAHALNNEGRAEAEALAARTAAETVARDTKIFIGSQKHTAAEADSIGNIGAENKATAGKKEMSVGPGMTKHNAGMYEAKSLKHAQETMQRDMEALLPKPHELISAPTQKPVQEKIVAPSPVAANKAPEVTNAASPLPLKETLEKSVASLAGVKEQLTKVSARLAELRDQSQNIFNKSSRDQEIVELEKESASLKKRIGESEKIVTPNTEEEISLIKEFESNVYNLKKEAVATEAKEHWEKEKTSGVDLNLSPEETIKKQFEGLSPEEKKKVGLGLHNIGFFIEEGKNQIFADIFGGARKKLEGAGFLGKIKSVVTGFGGQKELVLQAGRLDNWLLSFSENMQKNADASRKKIEEAERTSMNRLSSIGAVTSNTLKYGRVLTDLFGVTALTSPLRYYMMGGMMFGQGVAAMKEARFKNVNVLEKTRVKDINAAAEEAWRIYDNLNVTGDKGEGRVSVSAKEIEKAYLEHTPKDILNRLKKDAEPGTASSILQKILKKDIEFSVTYIDNQFEDIKNNASLDEVSKKLEREKILNKYEQHIKDLDRAVTQFGTIDALALGAKYGEVAAKALVGGVMAETLVLSIDKLWEKLPSLMHSLSEALPTNEIVMASTAAAEKIPTFIETAKPGDNVWKMVEHQLLSHEKGFATLSPEKQTYVIDALKDRVTANPQAFGLTDANKVSVGQSINFSKLLQDKDLVSKAFSGAQKLTDAQVENIKHYEAPTSQAPVAPKEASPSPVATPAPKDVPAQEYKAPATPGAPVASTEKVSYSKEGAAEKLTFSTGAPVDPTEAQKMVLNPEWRKEVYAHQTTMGRGSDVTSVQAQAITVAGYEKALMSLEAKGAGSGDEAKALRKNIEGIVKSVEGKYGDVFKNPEDFNKPAVSVPEKTVSPSAISSEILPGKPGIAKVDGLEMTNNPQSIATADTMVRGVIKTRWGSGGFLGFGGTDGMEVFKKYEHMTIKEVLALPDTGTDKQMHGVLNDAVKQTNIKWSDKEEVADYLHRATAVAIDKLSKSSVSRAELQNAPIFNP